MGSAVPTGRESSELHLTSQILPRSEVPLLTGSHCTARSTPAEVLSCLSQARLAPYRAAFAPSTDAAGLGCYQWGQALERIESLLSEGTPPMRKLVQPSPDTVVANLSFGFWPNLLESLSHRHAPRTFTDVFLHHPHSKPPYWSRDANKLPVMLQIKRLQELRNRVCHFEPIWKPHWFANGRPSARHWSHAVAAFRQFHEQLQQLLVWTSPETAAAYRASFAWDWFNKLCTTHAVKAFMDDHATSGRLMSMAAAVPLSASA